MVPTHDPDKPFVTDRCFIPAAWQDRHIGAWMGTTATGAAATEQKIAILAFRMVVGDVPGFDVMASAMPTSPGSAETSARRPDRPRRARSWPPRSSAHCPTPACTSYG